MNLKCDGELSYYEPTSTQDYSGLICKGYKIFPFRIFFNLSNKVEKIEVEERAMFAPERFKMRPEYKEFTSLYGKPDFFAVAKRGKDGVLGYANNPNEIKEENNSFFRTKIISCEKGKPCLLFSSIYDELQTKNTTTLSNSGASDTLSLE